MKKWLVLAAVFLGLALSGCVPSLHPLYTEKDVVFNKDLLGVWMNKENGQKWTFSKGDTNAYSLVCQGENGKTVYKTHLAKIKGHLFLDLFPEKPKLPGDDFYKLHFVPAHTFLFIRQLNNELKLSALDPDWLQKYLAAHPKAIKYEMVKDTIVLTAQPKELQAFLLKHVNDKNAFGKFLNMKRAQQ